MKARKTTQMKSEPVVDRGRRSSIEAIELTDASCDARFATQRRTLRSRPQSALFNSHSRTAIELQCRVRLTLLVRRLNSHQSLLRCCAFANSISHKASHLQHTHTN